MKRTVFVLLCVMLLLVFSGCSVLFFDTYYSEKDFTGNQSIDLDADIQMVHNYAELRRLVFDSMNNHVENMQLRFVGYSGNAVSDIASVCNAVKTESAYGAYCVDYVSYDLTQIVSYYEASIAISYKYSSEEVSLLQTTNNHDSFVEILAEELKRQSPKVVVKVNNGSSENAVVVELIEKTVREHPMAFSYYPEFTVKIYSGNSSQKIYEVGIKYDDKLNNEERIKHTTEKLNSLIQKIVSDEDAKRIGNAAVQLQRICAFDGLAGNTAYDACVIGQANSEGIASAFKAICDKLDTECLVVKGKYKQSVHYWNIVKVDNAYYHIDVSAYDGFDAASCFKRDDEQQINYWWDQSVYPVCKGE